MQYVIAHNMIDFEKWGREQDFEIRANPDILPVLTSNAQWSSDVLRGHVWDANDSIVYVDGWDTGSYADIKTIHEVLATIGVPTKQLRKI